MRLYNYLSRIYYYKLLYLNKKTNIAYSAYISKDSIVGKYCFVNDYTRITKTKIGNFVSIGNNVAIGQGEHDLKKLSTSTYFLDNVYEELTNKKCIIKNDVWIGSYAFIKRGVTIGNGAVIGTHAVVTKDVPDFAIVIGAPAKIIRYRFDKEIINKLLEIEWWNFNDKQLEKLKNKNFFNKELNNEIITYLNKIKENND